MTARNIVELDNIHLEFKGEGHDVNILRGIDLTIEAGKAIAILGPSGSGKSSLMSIMTGLEKATRGAITIAGQRIDRLNEDDMALFRRDHIGIVLQAFHLIPTMTALENVAVPLELAGRSDAFAVAEQSLHDVGLGHRLDHYPAQMSGGEQQRVAIARAVAPRPEILFADEPTGNLDGRTGQAVIELIFALREKLGTTMILITHDPELARKCDRILYIQDGLIDRVEELTDESGKAAE
ncbi:ABC transporter ATP-binding protein [Emcibacter nanhaiensis]|uniref:ABC transporter ATP-binding protein n=1 Tax=Emcibacter nanhaiensis TaxID=1505037 RepID=A0A501PTA0_9PROT|nr:ABC transporter ATP-binding protein [Emcibacter nanhaiensis]TPD62986.1 ABC transporter ATP-binding protein [Emcibacter nanhaiensis]